MSREETISDDDSMIADIFKEDQPAPVPQPFWECLKPAISTIECGKAFSFDPIGDLTLRVGEDGVAYEFVVCSRTLSRWSPVFRTMLFGGFAESRPADAAWSVSLPEDLPSAMFLVLSIIHGCFEHVPTSLSQFELYQTLAVTEKYDMTKIVRPWAARWFKPYKKISSIVGNEILLWVCWELGCIEGFRSLTKDLLLSSSVNDDGQLVGHDGVALSTYSCLEPPGILETVTNHRQELVSQMINAIYTMTDVALNQPKCRGLAGGSECPKCGTRYNMVMTAKLRLKCASCKKPGTADEWVVLKAPSMTLPAYMCNTLVFGSLVKQVKKVMGQEVALLKTPAPHIKLSINALLQSISAMRISLPEEHLSCNPLPATQAKVQNLVKKADSPVTEMHLEYLRNQAVKTGV